MSEPVCCLWHQIGNECSFGDLGWLFLFRMPAFRMWSASTNMSYFCRLLFPILSCAVLMWELLFAVSLSYLIRICVVIWLPSQRGILHRTASLNTRGRDKLKGERMNDCKWGPSCLFVFSWNALDFTTEEVGSIVWMSPFGIENKLKITTMQRFTVISFPS